MSEPFSVPPSATTLDRFRLREVLLFCLPALLVATFLRVYLVAQAPHAIFHPDSDDYLSTIYEYHVEDKFRIHKKKTFLIPVTYFALSYLPVPMLVSIPALQHFLGILLVAIVGLACRLSFHRWRWFIIPITMAIALNPWLLWYEHAILGEAIFGFSVGVVLLGTAWFWHKKDWTAFALMLGSLFLCASSRPEGKLFLGFGLLLICFAYFSVRKRLLYALAIYLPFSLLTWKINSTSQPGLLLYTSVAVWSPEESLTAPGIEPYMASLKRELEHRYFEENLFPKASHRRQIEKTLRRYLDDRGEKSSKASAHSTAKALGLETMARNPWEMVKLTWLKYSINAQTPPVGGFTKHDFLEKQIEGYEGDKEETVFLSKALSGKQRSLEEMLALVRVNAQPKRVTGLLEWQIKWSRKTLWWTSPPQTWKGFTNPWPGIPYVYLAAIAGAILSMLRPGPMHWYYIALVSGVVAFLGLVILTGPAKARFTYIVEIVWPLFFFAGFDAVWAWVDTFLAFMRRGDRETAPVN